MTNLFAYMKRHKTKGKRKLITIREWAEYTGLQWNVVRRYIKEYKRDKVYDPADIVSMLDFFLFLRNK